MSNHYNIAKTLDDVELLTYVVDLLKGGSDTITRRQCGNLHGVMFTRLICKRLGWLTILGSANIVKPIDRKKNGSTSPCCNCGKEVYRSLSALNISGKVYCSHSCAASQNNLSRDGHSEETKDKISKGYYRFSSNFPDLRKQYIRNNILNNSGIKVVRVDKICPECGNIFKALYSCSTKYCSPTCTKKHLGGYRERSGRSKTGYYKGIYCGSTYELVWVIYHLDHNIPFTRFPGYVCGDGIKYYPDFLIDTNHIVEIKGRRDVSTFTNRKTKIAEDAGYIVSVLYKEDIQYCFDYVKSHYQIRNMLKVYCLYDQQQFNASVA